MPTPTIDKKLLPLLDATEHEIEGHIEELVCGYAQPIIRQIVDYKLRFRSGSAVTGESYSAEDVYGDVVVRLVARLTELAADPERRPIANLRGYIATTTYNACDDYLRRKYPRRHSLKNRLRYLLSRDPQFVLWEMADRGFMSGLASWTGRPTSYDALRFEALCSSPSDSLWADLKGADVQKPDLSVAVKAILTYVGGPIEFDDLVGIIADLTGATDSQTEPRQFQPDRYPGRLIDEKADSLLATEDAAESVRRVWSEICDLPQRQRAALLLNLRDPEGDALIALLPALRVATLKEIAAVLEMKPEELAALWDKLPVDDLFIGELLGVTRQQVINLRKSARERLARRMKDVSAARPAV